MKKPSQITDVFFDLDHTLWDFEKNSALTFGKIFKINKIEVDLEAFLGHYVPINFNYWKLYREDRIEKETLRFARLDDTFRALNTQVPTAIINKLSADYIHHLSTFNYLVDHARDILDYLVQRYTLHIITNGFDKVQQGKLDKSNIAHYFATITNSETAGVKKPNAKIFKHALDRAKAKAENSVMVGDNLEADIEGALNMGMDAIFYAPQGSDTNGEVKSISGLEQLKHYL